MATREGMDNTDFKQRIQELYETLGLLNAKAHELEARIAYNIGEL